MKLLYLSHRAPYPPDKGERIRAYHLLRQLAGRHAIHVLCAAASGEEAARAATLASLGLGLTVETFPLGAGPLGRGLAAPLLGRPVTLAYYADRRMRRRAARLAVEGRCDAVIAYNTATAPLAAGLPVPRILDMVDVDSDKWAQYSRLAPLLWRPFCALESRRLHRAETALGRRVHRVVVSTGREKAILVARGLAGVVEVPNGVDTDYFAPPSAANAAPRAARPQLLFTGQMDYYPNVDGVVRFARGILPRLRDRFPALEFVILGRSPARAVRALAALPGVTVAGAVDDIRPFLARAWVFVAPLRIARGVPNKVLEAMACGLPVVCTTPALAGLGAGFAPEREICVAQDDGEMEAAVARLLGDAELRRRLAAAARARVVAACSWERSGRAFEAEILAARDLALPGIKAASALPATRR